MSEKQPGQARTLADQLKALESVQELDLKIDALKRSQSALPQALRALDETVTKGQGHAKSKQLLLDEAEKVQRQTRAALELNRDRLARSSARLEGVHNSQEFQAANKEIEQLKKLMTTLEEQAAKSEADATAMRTDIVKLTEGLTQHQADRDRQAATVKSQTGDIEGQIQSLLAERKPFASIVENRLLAQYDRVRPARAGVGIVPTVGGRCSGCNMMVPPQMYNEIQRGSTMHACPSCHRILFAPRAAGGETK